MLTTALTWGRDCMAEINEKTQHLRSDARQLWLPVTTIVGIVAVVFVGLIGAGMWIQKTNDKTATTDTLATKIEANHTTTLVQLAEMRGQLTVVINMAQTVSDVKSDVASLRKDLEEAERERRLFQDFVEGRIGSMPYRPSTEGGSR